VCEWGREQEAKWEAGDASTGARVLILFGLHNIKVMTCLSLVTP
jgi:hypothetical protein